MQLPGALPAAALLRGCRPCARAVEGARTVLSCSPHSSLQMASSFCFSFLQTASAGRPAAPRLALRTAGTSAWRRRGRGAHRWPPAWRSPASPARCSSTCCSASSRRPCRRRSVAEQRRRIANGDSLAAQAGGRGGGALLVLGFLLLVLAVRPQLLLHELHRRHLALCRHSASRSAESAELGSGARGA